ncbi:MAG: DUF58 domain-containing protein [Streptosporangiales bacterium]|nr:DUF58 domain-containing protein [Streptosporangiales bacterium]
MRQALASLTLRGRSFVAAGAAAMVCSVLLGEAVLLSIGTLLVVLPLAAAVVIARARYRLAAKRILEAPHVPAGHEAAVTLVVENLSRLPTGLLLVEEVVPYQLGSAPRFVLDRVEAHGVREIGYQLRSETRGRYDVGPLTVRLADPFGLVELTRSFTRVDKLVVTPTVHQLPSVPLTGAWTGGGDSHARTIAAAGEDDAATREYRHGDDLRRVHWKSTAKRGELMVRREEQHWQTRCTILLDSRHRAYHGEGPGSAFEFAVSAAASIGVAMARDGFGLRLVTDAGATVAGHGGLPDGGSGPTERLLLEELAMIRASRRLRLVDGHARRGLADASDSLLVAILGTLDDRDLDEVTGLRHGRGTGVAVLVDSASWASTRVHSAEVDGYERTVDRLQAAGWRVVPVRHGTSLAKVWRLAGGGPATPAATSAGADR